MSFKTHPPTSEHIVLAHPDPRILVVRIAREKQLNALSPKLQQELSAVFDWFEDEVTARLGGIPALYRSSPTLIPYLLAGLPIPQPLLSTHIFSSTVPTAADVLPEALKWAHALLQVSPDAVQVTKEQLQLSKAGLGDREVVTQSATGAAQQALYDGDNFKEGLKAFQEKREPKWVDPKGVRDSKL
ncbi:enoyl-CoA hydratase [Pseudohyphozyma bogoriensis]|nr:enoyl-CoA hydratase [Pseudohyphozyma bogoriensis]